MKKTIELITPEIKPSATKLFLTPIYDKERITKSNIVIMSMGASGKPKDQDENKGKIKIPRYFIIAKGETISEKYNIGDEIFIEESQFQPPVLAYISGWHEKIHTIYEDQICGYVKKENSDLNIKVLS